MYILLIIYQYVYIGKILLKTFFDAQFIKIYAIRNVNNAFIYIFDLIHFFFKNMLS